VRRAKRLVEVAWPEHGERRVRTQLAAFVDRLVDDVPLRNATLPVRDRGFGVADHGCAQLFRLQPLDPGCQLIVPNESMPAHPHPMLLGKAHQLVAGLEGEAPRLGFDCEPLHLVLGGE
jgi:hypothetical protein